MQGMEFCDKIFLKMCIRDSECADAAFLGSDHADDLIAFGQLVGRNPDLFSHHIFPAVGLQSHGVFNHRYLLAKAHIFLGGQTAVFYLDMENRRKLLIHAPQQHIALFFP